MTPSEPTMKFDVAKALAVWDEYQRTHDVSHLHGKAVGIDCETGEIYFGEASWGIHDQLRAAGKFPRPMYITRVGLGYYARMRPRRRCQ